MADWWAKRYVKNSACFCGKESSKSMSSGLVSADSSVVAPRRRGRVLGIVEVCLMCRVVHRKVKLKLISAAPQTTLLTRRGNGLFAFLGIVSMDLGIKTVGDMQPMSIGRASKDSPCQQSPRI